MPKNFTVKECAGIFKRSEDTIRRWIAEGFFKTVYRVKDGYLIPEAEITRIHEENKFTS